MVDSDLAARLQHIGPSKLGSLDPTAMTEFGHLLETFVVGELRKHVSWLDESATVGHWRTSEDDEVDFVVGSMTATSSRPRLGLTRRTDDALVRGTERWSAPWA